MNEKWLQRGPLPLYNKVPCEESPGKERWGGQVSSKGAGRTERLEEAQVNVRESPGQSVLALPSEDPQTPYPSASFSMEDRTTRVKRARRQCFLLSSLSKERCLSFKTNVLTGCKNIDML